MRLGYRLAAALGVGVLLLGAAGVMSLVTDSTIYRICGWIGVGLLVLALVVQVAMVSPRTRWDQTDKAEHSFTENLRTHTVGVSVADRRWARLGSLYMVLAALPCLVVAASNYFE